MFVPSLSSAHVHILLDAAESAYRESDYDTAVAIFGPLAVGGVVSACFYLGRMYETGRGVDKDDREAARHYEIAATAGLPEAQNNLGLMYESGRGVGRSEVDAELWLRRAAITGNEDAQLSLSRLYARGTGGVPRDLVEAYAWSAVAARLGNPDGAKNADRLRPLLSATEIVAGEHCVDLLFYEIF